MGKSEFSSDVTTNPDFTIGDKKFENYFDFEIYFRDSYGGSDTRSQFVFLSKSVFSDKKEFFFLENAVQKLSKKSFLSLSVFYLIKMKLNVRRSFSKVKTN